MVSGKTEYGTGKNKQKIERLWGERPISFILLSLFLDEETPEVCRCSLTHCYGSKKKQHEVILSGEWRPNNYKNLYDALGNCHFSHLDDLSQQMIEDYQKFILALHQLATAYWRLGEDKDYIESVCPWAIENYSGDKHTKLRIADIRQKVHYAQLMRMLEKRLAEKHIKAEEVPVDGDGIFYGTSYAHGIGILEICLKKGNEKLFLQLQGNSYLHGFVLDKGKDAAQESKKQKDKFDGLFVFSLPENLSKTAKRPVEGKFPKSLKPEEKGLQPSTVNKQAKGCLHGFKYYGKEFVYQNILIPQGVPIKDVIDAMAEETIKCWEILKNPKQ